MYGSFCYLVLRRLLQLVAFRMRSNEWKELDIVVLRHELAILRRQTRRPAIAAVDRLSIPLTRSGLRELLAARSGEASALARLNHAVSCFA